MLNRYYQEELRSLRERAAAFARDHPALAPMLQAPSADPDVERLLEGVAFLTGMVRGKLDDDFPEIIHGLMDLVFPHLLRPTPSASILAFETRANVHETVRVPAGTAVASIPVDGTSCRFRTCQPVEVHPLRLTAAEALTRPGQARIQLSFQLGGLPLSRWRPTELTLFLGESLGDASTLFLLLTRYLDRITVVPAAGGSPWVLPGSCLVPAGFSLERPLVPYPDQSFQGFRLLQDYFALPQNYLFLALRGWERWTDRGEGGAFRVLLDFRPAPVELPRIRPEHLVLGATPVVNLFRAQAEPFLLDHRSERFQLLPAGHARGHAQVFSVDGVTGFAQGTLKRRDYAPLNRFAGPGQAQAVYQVRRSRSLLDGQPETHLSLAYPDASEGPAAETITVELTCSNGSLPELLHPGEICRQTDESSELLNFRNLLAPTEAVEPELGQNNLWKLLSHLNLNLVGLARPGNLQDLLRLYCLQGSGRAALASHLKRIEGIQGFEVAPDDLLLRGQVFRGQRARLTADAGHFAGQGDLYLFASVLERFLAFHCGLNCHSRLVLSEPGLGETCTWPARLGAHPLS
jgi:type VI secretion system protein ImpG